MTSNSFAHSFRDPGGQIIRLDERIFRLVRHQAMDDFTVFSRSKKTEELVASGSMVKTDVHDLTVLLEILRDRNIDVANGTVFGIALEHERVPFVSFPAEWPPEMLHAAGILTLDLADAFLKDGFGLKDATPYNILFRGPKPVFIDVLSFERRNPNDATWAAYAQFVRTFLLPLFVNNHFGLSSDKFFLSQRDGIEPESVYRMASPLLRLLPPLLQMVSLPVWLSRWVKQDETKIYEPRRTQNPDKVAFILQSLFGRLRKQIDSLKPSAKQSSVWSDYLDSNNNYSGKHFAAKCKFVEDALEEHTPINVLDVGCNTGHFSAIAARSGAKVVAIDYDPVVVGKVWQSARRENLDILPLVVNLTRPTPGLGWRNAETQSFIDRAIGSFDAVFMLAVIHHMVVTEQIPLPEILNLAAALTTNLLIIEYVAPDDSMFRRLTRGREHLYSNITKKLFEAESSRNFTVLNCHHLTDTHRWIYVMQKNKSAKYD